MQHIGEIIRERNIGIDSDHPIATGGFTQVPNFILKSPALNVGEKVVYAMFLSYAWHNEYCFPGQERLAEDVGMSVSRVNAFIKGLEKAGLIEIQRRGQGKTNFYKIKFTVRGREKS